MSVHRQPENTNKSHAAHPSLGKAPRSKATIEQHLDCLRQWLKDEAKDMQESRNPNDHAYHQGRCSGLDLAIDLLEGRILEIDGN